MSYSAGDVVKFQNPEFPAKVHPHIVVAKTGTDSYLVVCSTQLDKVRDRCAYIEGKKETDILDTLVELPANAALSITETSGVNCNEVFIHNLAHLSIQDETCFRAIQNDNIGQYHFKKILIALCHSKSIPPELKKLLSCP